MKRSFVLHSLLLWTLFGSPVTAQGSRAQVRFEPTSAQVGEPVRVSVSFEHTPAEHPKLEGLGLDESWVVLDQQAGLDSSDPAHPERVTTTWVFEIASLEPGERTLANLPLQLGETKPVLEIAPLSVHGVLALDEDAPRGLRGLRDIETNDARTNFMVWIGLAAALLCVLLSACLWWRIRRRPAPVLATAPSSRLAILEAQPLDTPLDIRAAHFALTRLLREAGDLGAGRDRSGLTDEEWCAAAGAQFDTAALNATERSLLDQLFANASRVKYGSERPTHWATREALASARTLATRFEVPHASTTGIERKSGVAA